MLSPQFTKARSDLALKVKAEGSNSLEAQAARKHLKVVKVIDHAAEVAAEVAAVVDAAPPFSEAQRQTLLSILSPVINRLGQTPARSGDAPNQSLSK